MINQISFVFLFFSFLLLRNLFNGNQNTAKIAAKIAITIPRVAARIPPPIPGPKYAYDVETKEKDIKIVLSMMLNINFFSF